MTDFLIFLASVMAIGGSWFFLGNRWKKELRREHQVKLGKGEDVDAADLVIEYRTAFTRDELAAARRTKAEQHFDDYLEGIRRGTEGSDGQAAAKAVKWIKANFVFAEDSARRRKAYEALVAYWVSLGDIVRADEDYRSPDLEASPERQSLATLIAVRGWADYCVMPEAELRQLLERYPLSFDDQGVCAMFLNQLLKSMGGRTGKFPELVQAIVQAMDSQPSLTPQRVKPWLVQYMESLHYTDQAEFMLACRAAISSIDLETETLELCHALMGRWKFRKALVLVRRFLPGRVMEFELLAYRHAIEFGSYSFVLNADGEPSERRAWIQNYRHPADQATIT